MKFIIFLENAHENQAKNILKKKNIPNTEEVLFKLKEWLGRGNKKYLPLAAFFYHPERDNFRYIIQDFLSLSHLLSVNVTKKQVEILYRNKKYVFDQSEESWQKFEHLTHAIQARHQEKKDYSKIKHHKEAGKLIIKKNHIEIRLARNALEAVLLGRQTSFCISQPGTPHFANYRLKLKYTTYFIFDDNFPPDHPLHLVVYMINNRNEVLLTDLKNDSGTIQNPNNKKEDRGDYTKEYQNYLKKQGIPIDNVLIPIPLTEEEQRIVKKLGNPIPSKEEFIQLSPQDKVHYVTLGHQLTVNQLDYLIKHLESHPYDYLHAKALHHYLYNGLPLPSFYFPILKKLEYNKTNLLKHYLKYRIAAHNARRYDSYLLTYEEYQLLSPKEKESVVSYQSSLQKFMGDKFDKKKFKQFLSRIRFDVWNIIRELRPYPPEEQIKAYHYLFSLSQTDALDYSVFVTNLKEIKNLDVFRYVLDNLIKKGVKIFLPYLNEYFMFFPKSYRKEIIKKFTYMEQIDCSHPGSHNEFELLINTLSAEELIDYLSTSTHNHNITVILGKIVSFVSCFNYFPSKPDIIQAGIKKIAQLIKHYPNDLLWGLQDIFLLPQIPPDALQELLATKHPAVINVLVHVLSSGYERPSDSWLLKHIPDEILIYILSTRDTAQTLQAIARKLKLILEQEDRPRLESYLVQAALKSEDVFDIMVRSYVHDHFSKKVINQVLHRLPQEAPQILYQWSKKAFGRKSTDRFDVFSHQLDYYLWLFRYCAQHNPSALKYFYFPWNIQQNDIHKIEHIFDYIPQLMEIPYPQLHEWIAQLALPALMNHSHADKAHQVLNIFLKHVEKFTGSVKSLAQLLLFQIKREGWNNLPWQFLSSYPHKQELFQIIQNSHQLDKNSLIRIAQEMGL